MHNIITRLLGRQEERPSSPSPRRPSSPPPPRRTLEEARGCSNRVSSLKDRICKLESEFDRVIRDTEHLRTLEESEYGTETRLGKTIIESHKESLLDIAQEIKKMEKKKEELKQTIEHLNQEIKSLEERRNVMLELEQNIQTIKELRSKNEELADDLEDEKAKNRPDELSREQARTMYEENINQLTNEMGILTSAEHLQNVMGAMDMMNPPTFHVHDEDKLKIIRHPFVSLVNPMNILHKIHGHDLNVLTQQDIEEVDAVNRNYSKIRAAAELLSRLPRYQGWYECITNVLRDPQVKQSHVANMMDQALEDAERIRVEEERVRAEHGEAENEEQGAMAEQPDVNTLRDQMKNLYETQLSQLKDSIANLGEKSKIREAMKALRTESTAPLPFYNEDIVKKIRTLFVSSVNPLNVLHFFQKYDVDVLVQQDIDEVTSVSNNRGRQMGAAELLSRLPRYQNWFQCTLRVLRDREVKQGHVADAMEAHVRESEETEAKIPIERDFFESDNANAAGSGAIEMTEERKGKLEQAYRSQGDYQMEFTYGNAKGLKTRKTDCVKCSGPDSSGKFIPVKEFNLHHLPTEHRSWAIKKYVRSFADLCVLIAVRHTSNQRPEGYPLHELRGDQELYRLGNGWITSLTDRFKDENEDTCPCKECRSYADRAERYWGEFHVSTAKHLVYSKTECQFTQCLCFYDTDDPLSLPPRLQGVEIVASDSDTDICEIKCITHDYELFSKFECASRLYLKLCRDTKVMSRKEYSVVISHVHGLSKQISIGNQINIKFPNHVYNASTCLGSSGAPVCVLGHCTRWRKYDIMPRAHRRCIGGDVNESCGKKS